MKIALVTVSFLPHIGGAEMVVHSLAQQWSREGHDVCVFNAVSDVATHPDATYTVRKYHIVRGAARFGYHRSPFSWLVVRQMDRLLKEYQPEFISAHFGYPTGIWLSRITPVPRFLITCHGPALNQTPRGPLQKYGIADLLAESLNLSAGAVALSSEARTIMERIGVRPDNILDIPNGADIEKFSAKVTDFDLRSRFNLPSGAKIIISVGRSMWAKAHDTGIRAFAKLVNETPKTYYILLGKNTSQWQPLAHELGIGDKVVFCEGLYNNELVGAYQQADVFFHPSIKEMCPTVVPEAMAAGLPQVATNISGSQDMVQSGYNGFVVEPGDEAAMTDALLQLINDKPLRERMAQASLSRSKLYSWKTISHRYLEHA